jgi:hypothetical protein
MRGIIHNRGRSPLLRAGTLLALVLGACVNEPDGILFPCVRPEVLRTSPSAGDSGVARTALVTATFSTPMDSASFTPGAFQLLLGTDTIPGTFVYRPVDTTVVFTPADTLQPGATYTAFISPRVRDTAGQTMDTAYAWNFTTAGNPADTTGGIGPLPPDSIPPPPVLLAPANGATGVVPVATPLSWNAAPRATAYRLQVSIDPDFTTIVFDASGLTAPSQLVVGLLPLSTYYWRVNASNSAGTSPWSMVWNFSTLPSLPLL